jgi:phosphoribosylformylglycinamidine synthase
MSTETLASEPVSAASPTQVWRVEVHAATPADDPAGASVQHEVAEMQLGNLAGVRTARIFLLQGAIDHATAQRIASELLTDPVNQTFVLGSSPAPENASSFEVHYLPGVMDPVAESTQDAIREMIGADAHVEVRTGFRYDLFGATPEQADLIARRLLANTVIQSVHATAYHPTKFLAGTPYQFRLTHVNIRDLDEAGLMKLSREGHLFLTIAEMKAIQDYYIAAGREPTDIELETLAQTWSEHCVHKTLKSTCSYRETTGATPSINDFLNRPGHELQPDGTLVIKNILKSTIAAATRHLMNNGVDWCVSVFVDNAGVIRFDDTDAVTFKVETHNRPSAIEPYGGAATGIGGCIRDTMGTGLSAKPIANTDIFCVADPNIAFDDLPKGVLHPRRILKQVVAGVRDYGNRMGIPTVNGAVYFDDRYLGNPLVFAGSVGLIPLDKCFGKVQEGDRIIAVGGRTGRDGIHGATFSSAELTDTHADEFSHAVQIGNAIVEKKVLDVILQARDFGPEKKPLYNALTDCGAGGFSSAIGEMGKDLGAYVQLENAPLKYDGLSYTEIWISEAQERMVLSVPPGSVETLRQICEAEDVEMCDLGVFGTETREIVLTYHGNEVGRLSTHFLHEGIPTPVRSATWSGPRKAEAPKRRAKSGEVGDLLVSLLGHPNVASKHWIIRQYDHEVQGGSAVKPLVGPGEDGPSDAAVLRPKLSSKQGIALSNGLATALGDTDPYWMTLSAIDEAVRNAVCVGARPDRIAILDNFCWAKCDIPENLGSLIRAAEACYDGALAYRTPFISGKDSLSNQFTKEDGSVIAIPPTLLISAIGIVDDVTRCLTMDAKAPGNILLQIGATTNQLGGSHLHLITGETSSDIPRVNMQTAPAHLATVARLIASGLARSAHDLSEGGLLVAASEMAFAGRLGLELNLLGAPRKGELSTTALCFAENPTRILLEVEPARFEQVANTLRQAGVPFGHVGTFNDSGRLTVRSDQRSIVGDVDIETLRQTWLKPLDW